MEQQSPAEQALRQWAEAGDTLRVQAALDSILQTGVPDDLAARLVNLDTKLGFLSMFRQARQKLAELENNEPSLFKDAPDADAAALGTLPQQSAAFEQGITGFLTELKAGTAALQPADAEGRADLRHVRQGLDEADIQPVVLRGLQRLPTAPAAWIREQAGVTVSAVTENLWEVVSTGRDTVQFVADHPEQAARFLGAWKGTADESFERAGDELNEAINWLEGDA